MAIGSRKRILIHSRPSGVQPAQGQSSNVIFNPGGPQHSGYQNFNNDIGRLVPLAANTGLRILPANALRTILTIMNYDAANPIMYRFGAQATATEGYRVPAGGNALYDNHVPAQDVYIFSELGCTPGVWVAETCWQTKQI